MIELHCHTTYSDGRLTPTQLVEAAVKVGVRALAITDHDTLSGWDEAFAAAQLHELEIVPGLELSTVHRDRSLHILGFYPGAGLLLAPLTERLAWRKRRSQQMVDKLAELGYPIQLPEVSEGAAHGRPHIAWALMQAGYVRSAQEAFDRFLAEGKAAYVHYERFSSVDGIALLRQCGAVPVWAHPYLFRGGNVEAVLEELVAAGLMGVEVYHPGHSPSQVRTLERLAERHGLLISGGSDYHGPNPGHKKTEYYPALNSLRVPLSLLAPIKQAALQLKTQCNFSI